MTQIEAARKVHPTEALKQAANEEGLAVEELMELVATGKAVIPLNPRHAPIHPVVIGERLKTKVNVNIGSSENFPELENELKKTEIAIKYKTDTLMDLSTGEISGKSVRKSLIRPESP